MAFLVPLCYITALDNSGLVVSGARGYIYNAGTTTAKQSYSDYELTSANSVPYIIANSAGRFPPAYVEDGSLIRNLITSADGNTSFFDLDDILAPTPSSTTSVLHPYSAQTTSFAVDETMNGAVIGVDCTAGDISVTANSTSLGNGFQFTLQKINSGGGSVIVSGPGNIDGEASYTIDTPFESLTLSSKGSLGWAIVAQTSREEFGEIDLVTYTTSTTLQLSDKGKLLKLNSAGAMNLTLPPFSTVPLVIGSRVEGFQYGAGEVTIVAGAGVTIRSPGSFLDTTVQYSGFVATKIGTDEWWVTGQLEA